MENKNARKYGVDQLPRVVIKNEAANIIQFLLTYFC